MSISSLPLSYCTNVHPGRSVAEVLEGLERYAVSVKQGFGRPLAAGLWLAKPVIEELFAAGDGPQRLADFLAQRGFSCHTLNAFPFGNFHSARVKEKVYLPDWTTEQRLQYTLRCAEILAALLPGNIEGSISTLPLGFKEFGYESEFIEAATGRLIECARGLDQLRARTGKLIRLAIEPEPLCVLETTEEAIAFFHKLWDRAQSAGDAVRSHLGLCFDVCHQAVEFEEVAASIRSLDRAGVRINKVHISCALRLENPLENTEGRDALRRYVEPRYLHQVIARTATHQVLRATDLSESLIDDPDADFASAKEWRIHFHVPVDAERLGPLATTRTELKQAIGAVRELSYAPHLEVETYTWEVLPGAGPNDLIRGLARELAATDQLIRAG